MRERTPGTAAHRMTTRWGALRLATGRALALVVLVGAALTVSVGLGALKGDRSPDTGTVAAQSDAGDGGSDSAPAPGSDSAPAPGSDSASDSASESEAAADPAAPDQADLVAAEDAKLLDLVRNVPFGSAPYEVASDEGATLVLTAREASYGLADLVALGAAEVVEDGAVLVTTSVFAAPGASLDIGAPGAALNPAELRLRSDGTGFVSVVAWAGQLRLSGPEGAPLRVTSWDPAAAGPDLRVTDGRAYLRVNSGALEMNRVEVADLGFWSGRTGGLAVTDSSGTISGLTSRGLPYGLFASETVGLTVADSEVVGAAADGVLVHGGATDTTITDTVVRNSGEHGINLTRGSSGLVLDGVRSEANTDDGVRVNGAPLASDASAGGASTRSYGDVRAQGVEMVDNGGNGITVLDAVDVEISDSVVSGGVDGIAVRGSSVDVAVRGPEISAVERFGIAVLDGPRDVVVTDALVVGADTGVIVRGSAVDVQGASVRDARVHGVSLVGATDGTTLVETTVGGVGPSGIDTRRVSDTTAVRIVGSDQSGWTVQTDRTFAEWLDDHPVIWLWSLVLVVVVIGLVLALRRKLGGAPAATSFAAGAGGPGADPRPGHGSTASDLVGAGARRPAALAAPVTRVTVVS